MGKHAIKTATRKSGLWLASGDCFSFGEVESTTLLRARLIAGDSSSITSGWTYIQSVLSFGSGSSQASHHRLPQSSPPCTLTDRLHPPGRAASFGQNIPSCTLFSPSRLAFPCVYVEDDGGRRSLICRDPSCI
jgi:hypothetical protein